MLQWKVSCVLSMRAPLFPSAITSSITTSFGLRLARYTSCFAVIPLKRNSHHALCLSSRQRSVESAWITSLWKATLHKREQLLWRPVRAPWCTTGHESFTRHVREVSNLREIPSRGRCFAHSCPSCLLYSFWVVGGNTGRICWISTNLFTSLRTKTWEPL